ncbi:MAG: AraC family transcriptional regulator [Armatimonadota bacterium]
MPLAGRNEAISRQVYSNPGRDTASSGLPLLPEIEMLGYDLFPAAKRSGLPLHRHAAAFEICYIVDGLLFWHLRDQTYCLRRGDVFVTPPNEPHGGEDAVMQPCEIYWVQVVIPQPPDALSGITAEQTETIRTALETTSLCPAFSSKSPEDVAAAFEALMRIHRDAKTGDVLSPVAARAALQTLLVQIVRDADESARRQNQLSVPLARALDWMETHLGEPFTIDTAAAAAEISTTAFHDRFQREVGATPAEWRTRKRIERAKSYLIHHPEKTVTEIALMLGFKSSQYFATAFKRHTAHTPTEYRQDHQSVGGA